MVNASPDLAAQINSFPELHPALTSPRNSPIAGVFLTNADLDHVLGLFALREGGRLNVFAPLAIREPLCGPLGMEATLNSFCGVEWHEFGMHAGNWFGVPPSGGSPDRVNAELQTPKLPVPVLTCRTISLPGGSPLYAPGAAPGPHSVAYQFRDEKTGGRLLVAPDVAAVNAELSAALKSSDAVLFDGTFWSGDDLTAVRPGARTPELMGHVTIKDCSLDLLAKLPAKRKIYTHLNNTNPVLSLGSPERAAVESAGIIVGCDAAIMSNCPIREIRRLWLHRITDHDGMTGDEGGIGAWLRLGEACGLAREELLDTRHVVPGVRFAVDAYVNFARTQPWPIAVASSLTELFAPDLMAKRLEAFQTHYAWVEARGLEYFQKRLTQAKRDSGEALTIAHDYCTTREMQEAAVRALRFKCDLLWAQLDAIHLKCSVKS